MTTFITAIACIAVLFAIASLVAGHYHFEAVWKYYHADESKFAAAALREGYMNHLRRNILILVVGLCWLIFGTDWFFNQAEAQEPPAPEVAMPPRERITRPEYCSQFLYERTEDEWDEERHEYWPPNHEWEKCMGVERRG